MPLVRGGTKPITGIVRPEDRVLTPTTTTGTIPFPTVGGKITLPTGGTVAPVIPTTGPTTPFGITDPNALPKSQTASQGNLAARLQIPQLENPPLQPPAGVPQRNQSQILLPDVYRQTPQGSPSIYPPLTIRNGITMPSASPGVKPQSFPGMNWSDFLTVVHNAYTR